MGTGQELYEKAKMIIPGGTQLLSKRPEMFAPNQWPAYYSKAKGCKIWDMDGKEYTDVSYMGIGANVLGYANDEVDEVVKDVISNGSMCTLNAPEEVYLTEKMLELHPWAGGVRYAKAGGESVALAVRIARAYTHKDRLLFCGYHGWHDWYLSANLTGDELADQHLAGLEPAGVPKGLRGTNIPFHYNNIQEFESLVDRFDGEIAAVVMEPIRNDYPRNGFLEKIRRVTKEKGIVLIFDEITAGFRLCAGGSHMSGMLGDVAPDIACFAKGLTNGYPLSAIVGTKEVMSAAQDTFISSTFFTERIGFTAALKNIEVYEKNKVWEKQISLGKRIKEGWKDVADNNDIPIEIGGIDPLAHFSFPVENFLPYKTYITQEMLKKGYLASNAFYTSMAHDESIVDDYLKKLDEVFCVIGKTLKDNKSIEEYLEGPVCQSGFQRLN